MAAAHICCKKAAALKIAADREQQSFNNHLMTSQLYHGHSTKQLIKELTREELEHNYILEKTLCEESVRLCNQGDEHIPSMSQGTSHGWKSSMKKCILLRMLFLVVYAC
jgi:hypothetical protein